MGEGFWNQVLVAVRPDDSIETIQSMQYYSNDVRQEVIEQVDWEGLIVPGRVLAAITWKQDEVVVVSYEDARESAVHPGL